MRRPPRGTHISAQRRHYAHHGIYVGYPDSVIHFEGPAGDKKYTGPSRVRIVPWTEFARGARVSVVRLPDDDAHADMIIHRASRGLCEGWDHYNLLSRNCEHFSTWCVENRASSAQIHAGVLAVGGVSLAAAYVATMSPVLAATSVVGVALVGML